MFTFLNKCRVTYIVSDLETVSIKEIILSVCKHRFSF
jgi:hypothetical protein